MEEIEVVTASAGDVEVAVNIALCVTDNRFVIRLASIRRANGRVTDYTGNLWNHLPNLTANTIEHARADAQRMADQYLSLNTAKGARA